MEIARYETGREKILGALIYWNNTHWIHRQIIWNYNLEFDKIDYLKLLKIFRELASNFIDPDSYTSGGKNKNKYLA